MNAIAQTYIKRMYGDFAHDIILVSSPWEFMSSKARGRYRYRAKRWVWNMHVHGKARSQNGGNVLLVGLHSRPAKMADLRISSLHRIPVSEIGKRKTIVLYAQCSDRPRRGSWIDRYAVAIDKPEPD